MPANSFVLPSRDEVQFPFPWLSAGISDLILRTRMTWRWPVWLLRLDQDDVSASFLLCLSWDMSLWSPEPLLRKLGCLEATMLESPCGETTWGQKEPQGSVIIVSAVWVFLALAPGMWERKSWRLPQSQLLLCCSCINHSEGELPSWAQSAPRLWASIIKWLLVVCYAAITGLLCS